MILESTHSIRFYGDLSKNYCLIIIKYLHICFTEYWCVVKVCWKLVIFCSFFLLHSIYTFNGENREIWLDIDKKWVKFCLALVKKMGNLAWHWYILCFGWLSDFLFISFNVGLWLWLCVIMGNSCIKTLNLTVVIFHLNQTYSTKYISKQLYHQTLHLFVKKWINSNNIKNETILRLNMETIFYFSRFCWHLRRLYVI